MDRDLQDVTCQSADKARSSAQHTLDLIPSSAFGGTFFMLHGVVFLQAPLPTGPLLGRTLTRIYRVCC